ncbi:MAG: glycosyltransferase family 25 protein [Nodosilinea sp. LVE1205-7]|jgi:GR25 family glycosyltransferase involved in LPS biosynthesis
MNIKDFFDRIYIVNLPSRADRRRWITSELKRVGLELTPGKIEIFPAIRPDHPGGFTSIGARGCFLSHLEILKKARQERLANVLVIEDDLAISNLLKSHEEALVEKLQESDWGFLYLGHCHEFEKQPEQGVRLEPFIGELQTTHFYGVNGPIVPELIEFLEQILERPPGHPDGGPMHVDGAYSRFREKHAADIVTLITSPSLGSQAIYRSDITTSWTDEAFILKDLRNAARKVRLHLRDLKRTIAG